MIPVIEKPDLDSTLLAEALALPPSIAQILWSRGIRTVEHANAFLSPALDQLTSPEDFTHMRQAVRRLREAIVREEPIALYADRDVDGLTGLAILVRTLRSLGASVVWGSPVKGRGLERAVLEQLIQHQPKILVFVDCGTNEATELKWVSEQGVEIIVADHHRLTPDRPEALAWIHPEVRASAGVSETASGCVMAFKLAQALWTSYLGETDPARLDYFLFDHLDLVSLGILADRVPVVGENRTLVWHGLQRLAQTRKVGLACLNRFCRLTPRAGPITVHEAIWRLIPLLNAAGRLGRPEVTTQLLLTEDPAVAWQCVDDLLVLNSERRSAQTQSLESFEKAVLEQCSLDCDAVIVALAEGLEPSVTGLAAQSLVRKYGRPAFLFVARGEEAVGSGRGLPGVDLFAWVQAQSDLLIKFGGHEGAVGLTVKTADFPALRQRLLDHARQQLPTPVDIAPAIESELLFSELQEPSWWLALQRLGPFGTGHPWPVFRLRGVPAVIPPRRRQGKIGTKFALHSGETRVLAEFSPERTIPEDTWGEGPWTVVGYPIACRKSEGLFKWIIQDVWRTDG